VVKDDFMETKSGASGIGMAGPSNLVGGGAKSCTDGYTTPVMSVKRKGTLSPFNFTAEDSENQIEGGLAYVKSLLKAAMNEARLGGQKSESSRLMKLLEDI